uniref:Uncharacterized protein n=1 Tax=Arundo donax TaxID=35708 RepID=A0A0A9AI82_ARUDO
MGSNSVISTTPNTSAPFLKDRT